MSRRRFFKRCARKRLFSDWIKQIFAVLIVGAICTGLSEFGVGAMQVIEYITSDVEFASIVYTVYLSLIVAIAIPLIYGLLYFEIRASEYNKSDLRDLFYAFSSAEIFVRSYSLFFNFVLRAFFGFIPAVVLGVGRGMFEKYFPYLANYTIKNVNLFGLVWQSAFMIFLFVGFVLSARQIFGVYVCIRFDNIAISDGFFTAKACMYGSRGEMTWLFVSFLPLFVVSLYSFGLLLLMYFLPYLLITFTLYSKYIYDEEMYTRNTANILYFQDNQEI